MTEWRSLSADCLVVVRCEGEVGDDDCVIAAGGGAVAVEVVDVLDGPVWAYPDGVEAPRGSWGVLAPPGSVSDSKWPVRRDGERGGVLG